MFIKKIRLLFLIFLILDITVFSQNPYFLSRKPLTGDGIYSFLRRFKLDDNSCHLNKFLELNGIDKNEQLHLDKEYQLPILIYQYNGKSIRTSIGIDDYNLAVNIKNYNDFLYKNKVRTSEYTDSKLLWVKYGDLNCPDNIEMLEEESTQKHSKEYKTEKLFGKNYEKVELIDKELENRIFYIVSGHGGPDPGARYVGKKYTLCEDEYAYDVCLRLAKNLIEHGATVYIIIQDPNDGIRDENYFTCDKDEKSINNKSLPVKQLDRLKQRVDDINELYKKNSVNSSVKSQTVIVIHVDARNYDKRQDVFYYYYSLSGKKIAQSIQDVFEKKYRQIQHGREYMGTVSKRDLYVIKNTLPTAIYIELGNIQNTFNQKRLILFNNRQALANWIYLGLTNSL